MSRTCQITGKKPQTGNNRSHSMRATKRIFRPNLFWKMVIDPVTGNRKRMKIASSTLKTLTKKGLI